MIEDEYFTRAHRFPMDGDAKERILEDLQWVPTNPPARRGIWRQWTAGAGAGLAGMAILIGGIAMLQRNAGAKLTGSTSDVMSETGPAGGAAGGTAASPNQALAKSHSPTVEPSRVITRSDGSVMYDFTNRDFLPAVQEHANFAVKVPNISLSTETFQWFPSARNQGYSRQVIVPKVSINGYVGNESLLIQEMPDVKGMTTPFDALVGSGKGKNLAPSGKPQTVIKNGVIVRVGWPTSKSAHCYQFTRDGVVYYVKSHWNHPWAPIASEDTVAWKVVQELMNGRSVN